MNKVLKIAIHVLFIIDGIFLIIYELVTGANLGAVISALVSSGYPIGIKELYTLIGIARIIFALGAMKSTTNEISTLVCGIFFVLFSIAGVSFSLIDGETTTFYVIEAIVMFIPSLYYLLHAIKQARNERANSDSKLGRKYFAKSAKKRVGQTKYTRETLFEKRKR